MQWMLLLAGTVALTDALALPFSGHVLHEKRGTPFLHRRERADPDAIIPVRIGLKQENLHTGYDRLMDVSHPSSANYGQHLSPNEVHSLFAPAEDTVRNVKDWLLGSGVHESDILPYTNKGWLAVDMPAKDAERLLRTKFFEYETADGLKIGCDEYYLPTDVSQHVDLIKPGVKLSAPLKKTVIKREGPHSGGGRPGYPSPPHTHSNPFPHWHMPPAAHGLPLDLQNCGVNITPVCIKALYDIPSLNLSDSTNAMGVFESYDAFSQSDIDLFFENFAPWVPQGTAPDVISVDGGTAPVAPSSVRNGGESDIDIVCRATAPLMTITDLYFPTGAGILDNLPTASDGV